MAVRIYLEESARRFETVCGSWRCWAALSWPGTAYLCAGVKPVCRAFPGTAAGRSSLVRAKRSFFFRGLGPAAGAPGRRHGSL